MATATKKKATPKKAAAKTVATRPTPRPAAVAKKPSVKKASSQANVQHSARVHTLVILFTLLALAFSVTALLNY